MTRLLLIFISLSFSTVSVGQNNFCLSDTFSASGQILQRLKAEGIAGLTITNKRTGKKYQGYKICEHHYLQLTA